MSTRTATLLIAILLGLASVAPVRADDVPRSIREHYEEAQRQLDAGNLKKAFAAISKGKAKTPDSVDFWELYVAIYRGMGKKEKVLWGKIVAKAEAKYPSSPTFHLLRFRLAADIAEGITHLEQAIEVAPDAVAPKALLAREHVRCGRADDASTLMEEVLALDPANEIALALQGDLALLAGNPGRARDLAERLLSQHGYPALRDLHARALLALGGNDPDRWGTAAVEARRAHEARPKEWRYALTLAAALDRQGKEKEAAALLEKTHAKTPAPEVAAKLGELLFRAGSYTRAAKGIARHPFPDVRTLRALACCHARLGRAGPARDALERLLKREPGDESRLFAAARELELGDAGAARRRLEGLEGRDVDLLRVRVAAWAGDFDEAKRVAGKRAHGETRAAEDWFLPIAHALLFERLGGKAQAARKQLLEATASAARADVKTATVPADEPLLVATTLGCIQRYATYRRALDGTFFVPQEEIGLHQKDVDDIPTPIVTVDADSSCARDPKRTFTFQPAEEVKDFDLQKTMTTWLGAPAQKRWTEALGGFAEGCEALHRGDPAAARQAFTYAVEKEPHWGRARVLKAVAIALGSEDLREAAREAAIASEALIDDWDGRTAAVLVRLLAGESVSAELKALAERRDAFAPRLYDEL